MEHDPQAAWMRAMRTGDFAAAHAISDEVLRARDPAAHDDCNLPYHLRWVWDGRPFDGKDVLVRCYHGLGDTLQFARFLPTLARRTASLHVETQPALVPLLRMLPGPGKLIPFQPASPAAPRACDLEIMELLHALRVMPSTIPPPPVLRVPPLRMAARAIGLCWSAGDWDPARSVPLAQLLAACELAEVELVSLQRGPAADAALRYRFINAHDRDTDMLRTARLIAGLDLVITVDTMVAHLAGTLGTPVWLLLRRHADWRWMQERADSPWYPSMRLYRQAKEGHWDAPLERLAADLRRLGAGSRP